MDKKVNDLTQKARTMRKLIIEMLSCAQSGHPGGSLSSTDIIATLFFDVMRMDPDKPDWPKRDRFHISKGHCCPAVYAALSMHGYFPQEELKTLRKLGALLQGHPDRRTPGIELASGSLGQGLSVSVGMALAGKLDKADWRVYCLMGDGEIQEGNVWEAAMAAAHYKLDNLCGIVDCNGFQIDGRTQEVMGLEPLVKKWESFGWNAIECDGHSIPELLDAFAQAKACEGRPTIIIAHTVKGKGVSFMEHVVDFHGRAPTAQEREIALKEIERLQTDGGEQKTKGKV